MLGNALTLSIANKVCIAIPQINVLFAILVRHTVIMAIKLNMVVNIDPGLFIVPIFIALLWQWPHGWFVN